MQRERFMNVIIAAAAQRGGCVVQGSWRGGGRWSCGLRRRATPRDSRSAPASPRAPIDLSVRPPHSAPRGLGRSPLASRSLQLPPTPPDSSLMKSNLNESTSPLLRAYLANNKNRIFKPIDMSSLEEPGVSLLPLDPQDSVVGSVGLSPCTSRPRV